LLDFEYINYISSTCLNLQIVIIQLYRRPLNFKQQPDSNYEMSNLAFLSFDLNFNRIFCCYHDAGITQQAKPIFCDVISGNS